MGEQLGERESEVYDRQIRLWGVEVQMRMSTSTILFAGFGSVCAEAAKNLVLAGINATLQDAQAVTYADLGANFFLEAADVGSNRAAAALPKLQAMNGLATVRAETRGIDALDDAFFSNFTVIVLYGASLAQQRRLGVLVRKTGISLVIADCFGFYGYLQLDLGTHKYRRDAAPGSETKPEPITAVYPSIEEALSVKWSSLKNRWGPIPKVYMYAQLILRFEAQHKSRPLPSDSIELKNVAAKALAANDMPADHVMEEDIQHICSQACTEMSPVCAVMGGILGQEIIKILSEKGEPAMNTFVFDGTTSEGRVFLSAPPKQS